MSEAEARLLQSFVELEIGVGRACALELGNGEWVCTLIPRAAGDDLYYYYLWSPQDWNEYLRTAKAKQRTVKRMVDTGQRTE